MKMSDYRKWLKENYIDGYQYAVWLRRNFPNKMFKDINTTENQARYLEERSNELPTSN